MSQIPVSKSKFNPLSSIFTSLLIMMHATGDKLSNLYIKYQYRIEFHSLGLSIAILERQLKFLEYKILTIKGGSFVL